jgi:hypothetical protein
MSASGSVVNADWIVLGERIPIIQGLIFPNNQDGRDAAFQGLEDEMTADLVVLLAGIAVSSTSSTPCSPNTSRTPLKGQRMRVS